MLARRAIARAIDATLVATLAIAAATVVGQGAAWFISTALGVWAWFALPLAITGATLGKAVMGLRVVDAGGGRPTLAAAFRRESFTLLGAVPLIGPLAAMAVWVWIAMAIHRDQSPPHERWSGARVVAR